MKLSRAQATQRLQQISGEVKELSKGTRATVTKIQKIKGSISQKKDQSKIDSIRKKLSGLN